MVIPSKHKKLLLLASIGIVALGILVTIGWLLDISLFKSIFPGYPSMKFNTAIGLILLGSSLSLIVVDLPSRWKTISRFFSAIVIIIGTVSFTQELLVYDAGIDQLIITDHQGVLDHNPHPGRMSPIAAFCLTLLGFAFFAIDSTNKSNRIISQFLMHLTSMLAFITLVGYIFNVPTLHKFTFFTSMAFHTSVALLIFSSIATLKNPTLGITGLFTGNNTGSEMVRRLFPRMLITILLLGFIRLASHRNNWVNVDFGIALHTTSFVFLSLFLLWITSQELNHLDEVRLRAVKKQILLEALVNSSHDAIISKTLDGVITSWNMGAYRIFGYTEDEMLGKNISTLIPSERLHEETMILNKVRGDEFIEHYETERLRKDGSLVSVSLTISPIKDSNGNIIGVSKNAYNITAQKKNRQELLDAQNKIAESERHFRALIENSDSGILLTNEKLHVSYQSPAVERMTGISLQRRQSNPNVTYTHPDDKSIMIDAIELSFKKLNSPIPFQVRFLHFNGNYIWIEGVMTNLLNEIDINAIVFNFRDITDRKELENKISTNEKRFRALIENDYSITSLLNEKFESLYRSPSADNILGWAPEERKKMSSEQMTHPDDKNYMDGIRKDVLTNPRKIVPMTIQVKHKNGKYIWLEGIAINLLDDPGIGGIVTNLHDITARKELVDKITKRTIELEESNKELEAFSYSVSHDLRTPLRAINGYAKILEEDYVSVIDDDGQRLLKQIKHNASTMGILVDDLLAFSRLGRKDISKTNFDMTEVVEEVIWEINKAHRHDTEIKFDQIHSLCADRSLIKQVWINLISNAIKYSSKKKNPSIEIGSEEKDNEFVFYVKDNGSGFDMTFVAKLFNVFQRLHSVKEFEGTGIGLALVKRIILKHLGKVWADGKENEGATFYFSLPKE